MKVYIIIEAYRDGSAPNKKAFHSHSVAVENLERRGFKFSTLDSYKNEELGVKAHIHELTMQ